MCISHKPNRRVQPLVLPASLVGQKLLATDENNGHGHHRQRQTDKKDVQPPVPSAVVLVKKVVSHQEHQHFVVQHDYHDHSHEADEKIAEPRPVARGGVTTPFPLKLHEMLEQIEMDGLGHVISWQPHGRCFCVHQPKEFVRHVMPTYFSPSSKFASFQRQLNLYGFNRITQGPDKGGYYHEWFLRGKPNLTHRIQRTKVKGTGVRARSNPDNEPNFYAMAPVQRDGTVGPVTTMEDTSPKMEDHNTTSLAPEKGSPVEEEITSASSSMEEEVANASTSDTDDNTSATSTTVATTVSYSTATTEDTTLAYEPDCQVSTTANTYVIETPHQPQQRPPSPSSLVSASNVACSQSNENMSIDSDDDDIMMSFGGMTFHPISEAPGSSAAVATAMEFLPMMQEEFGSREERDQFLNTLNISRELYKNIVETVDDDLNFGNLLERVIE